MKGKVGRKVARFFLFVADVFMENQDPIAQQISVLIEPVLVDLGYELVEVQFRTEQHGQVLRVVIYKDTGIGVEDCTKVNREVSYLLDVEDIIDQAYNLEISSPGLDWRLKNERDFARCSGKKVRIVLKDGSEPLVGLIGKIEEDRVELDVDGSKIVVVFDEIKKAKLVIQF